MDFKVLGDHSYFERLKDEIPSKKETSPLNNSLENVADENVSSKYEIKYNVCNF